MSKYKVLISGINTSSLKVLSSEETLDLFNKMHEGDMFARDELVKGNLKLWIPTCSIDTFAPLIKDEGPFCKSGSVLIYSSVTSKS